MTWLEAGTDNAWGPSEYILADLYDLQQLPQDGTKLPENKRYPRPSTIREQVEAREAMLAKAARFRERKRKH